MFRSPDASTRALSLAMALCLVTVPVAARADDAPSAPTGAAPEAPPPPPPTDQPSGTTAAPPSAPEPPAPPPAVVAPAPASVPDAATVPTPASTPASTIMPRTEVTYRRPRTGLLAAGLVLFVAGYAADVGFTYGYDHQPGWTSLIPVVGPFIQMGQPYGLDGPAVDTGNVEADARVTRNLDTANKTIRALALTGEAVVGALQLAGVALIIAGAVTKRKLTRYARSAPGGVAVSF